MVRSRDQNDIEIAGPQHLSVIGERLRPLSIALPRGHHLSRLAEHATIDVTKRNDFHRGDLNEPEQIGLAIPSTADQANTRRPRFGRAERHGAEPLHATAAKTIARASTRALRGARHDLGRVSLRTAVPLFVDEYRRNRITGSFIMIDEGTFETVGAGMILGQTAP